MSRVARKLERDANDEEDGSQLKKQRHEEEDAEEQQHGDGQESQAHGDDVGEEEENQGDDEEEEEGRMEVGDDNNIDSALLEAETAAREHASHYGGQESVNVDVGTDAATAAVTATYNQLLQHNAEREEANRHSGGDGDGSDSGHDNSRSGHTVEVQLEDPTGPVDEKGLGGPHGEGKDSDGNESVLDELSDATKRIMGKRGRKPAVVAGTEAWKLQRKESHKEVERRRRENINTAINSLSDLLPVKESSKAAILTRAAEYIQKMKETENANIEKWTLQKLLSEQNASQLSTANEKLQEALGNAFKEIEYLKKLCKKHGVSVEEGQFDETD
ncbi:Cbf1p KNAG_0B00250 [Huiozyma naganishii CBS 8797]|uniref:BHLH domain-containing protein n=1 Tax=Huiozyma naganishii (strain ATCC MYA-139 / BCRC 22969 / CBS 8797 / KCTC 17520 / NBRC 10181 / NCYC 3082 / Yp74L-3) TaxID=1071383 RepID=J7S341_HUIN7|nr:hypothetical protein KNAG_0B00250 [Kazachstania naganishii CBS 8797]CCK68474.1 hypothetical protein KNAG_0B00250 [Kazachstania naganishii CBS 8797]